jgi:hypothetical protein
VIGQNNYKKALSAKYMIIEFSAGVTKMVASIQRPGEKKLPPDGLIVCQQKKYPFFLC